MGTIGTVTEVLPGYTKVAASSAGRADRLIGAMTNRRRFPFWFRWFAIGAVTLIVLAAIAAIERQQHSDAREAITTALHDGSLASSAAFQARCGQADAVRGAVLEYRHAGVAVRLSGKDVIFAAPDRHGKFDFDTQRRSDDYAIGALRCK
jgi:hypothetical protein